MYQKLTAILFFAGFATAWAQPTLQRSDFLRIGDRFARIAVAADQLDPGQPGSNQVWDFRQMKPLGPQLQHITILAPEQSPQGAAIQGCNVVEQIRVGNRVTYHYQHIDETGLDFIAVEDNGQTIPFGSGYRLMHYPFSLNANRTANFTSSFVDNGIAIERAGTVTTTADAVGTLQLPHHTYTDVLRLKTVHTMEQTTAQPALAQRIILVTYSWHTPGRAYPLMALVDQVVAPEQATETLPQRTAWYLAGSPDDTTPTPERWLTHLALFGGNFVSEVLVRNNGSSGDSLTLIPYTEDGQQLTPVSGTPAPGQQLVVRHEQLDTRAAYVGVAGCADCTVAVGYRAATGGGTAHVQATQPNTSFTIYPGEWDVLFDGLALVNLGNSESQITASLLNLDGSVMDARPLATLAPGAKTLANFETVFEGNRSHAVRIDSSQAAIFLALRGSRDGRFLYENRPLSQGPTAERWVPHLALFGGNFLTSLFVHNPSDRPHRVVLSPYDSGGALLPTQSVDLAPGAFATVDHQSLGEQAASLRVEGCLPCVTSSGFRAAQGGGTAQVHQSTPATSFTLFPGEWDVLFDGLALVNVGDGPTRVTGTVLDDSSAVVRQITLSENLPVHGKLLANFEQAFEGARGAAIRIETDQPVSLLMLRGSRDGRFLYENVPF